MYFGGKYTRKSLKTRIPGIGGCTLTRDADSRLSPYPERTVSRMNTSIRLIAVFSLLLLSSFAVTKDKPAAYDVDARRKQLDALLKDQWEYTLRTSPEFASILGDKRYNDKLTDFSQAAIVRDQRVTREYLK